MKKLLFAIALALAATFSACWRTVYDAGARVYRLYRSARDWLIEPFTAPTAAKEKKPPKPPKYITPHVLADRAERPRLSPTWRMCPST